MQAGQLQLEPEMSLLVLRHFTDLKVSESKIFHPVICGQLRAFLRGITQPCHWQTEVFSGMLFPAGSLHIHTCEVPEQSFRAIVPTLTWESFQGWDSFPARTGMFLVLSLFHGLCLLELKQFSCSQGGYKPS